ncbi:metalloregulator ArsR/SmtB family transcription factor [Kibdelosporangium persicum]|uniref:Arsenic resistance operon repressor ArsR n=1 Tax=Kibdelosporangium persicum TaxID=2698649 RepID=A0ABX2F3R5_9PSEU|nr:metalloregulator ArsR/SmtB family transcription factor [Kibdelosporangium persicum]NRN65789.1 Arsenic resistance operon repressor ArsR [Kibdelosporangium persicum]
MARNAAGVKNVDEVVSLVALPAGSEPLDPDDSAAAASLFKALADPIRLQLVALVRQAPSGEACFCDLADEFDMPQSSLSHHLKVLVQAGILERERRGTWSWYQVADKPWDLIERLIRPGGPFRDKKAPTKRGRRNTRC